MCAVDDEVIAAVASKKTPKGKAVATPVAKGPPPPPGITMTTPSAGPSCPHDVRIRFVLLVDGKVKRY